MTPPRIARPCRICGTRVTNGTSTCPRHKGHAHRTPTSCKTCGRLGPTSFCPQHQPAPYGGPDTRTPEQRQHAQPWRAGYRDPNYHRERQATLNRAHGHCENCGNPGPLEVDHIIRLKTATTLAELHALNKRTNLQALCLDCHRDKTSRDRRRT